MQRDCMYPLIYMQSRRCIQTTESCYALLSLWHPLCQRLNLSCLHLIVGSGRVDVRHDRVIKLRYFRRSSIMNDAYRNEDVIRHDLTNAFFHVEGLYLTRIFLCIITMKEIYRCLYIPQSTKRDVKYCQLDFLVVPTRLIFSIGIMYVCEKYLKISCEKADI